MNLFRSFIIVLLVRFFKFLSIYNFIKIFNFLSI